MTKTIVFTLQEYSPLEVARG